LYVPGAFLIPKALGTRQNFLVNNPGYVEKKEKRRHPEFNSGSNPGIDTVYNPQLSCIKQSVAIILNDLHPNATS